MKGKEINITQLLNIKIENHPLCAVGISSINRVLQVDYHVFFCSSQTEQPALGGPVFVLSG